MEIAFFHRYMHSVIYQFVQEASPNQVLPETITQVQQHYKDYYAIDNNLSFFVIGYAAYILLYAYLQYKLCLMKSS